LRSFAANNCRAVENDRERFSLRARAHLAKNRIQPLKNNLLNGKRSWTHAKKR